MEQIEFYRAIKQHCAQSEGQCEKCCLRLYCYTPPCELTDCMMENVISFLFSEHSHTEGRDRSDHYTCVHLPQCPCDLDMSTALGSEHR